ncbi:MAG: hypothetical protein U0133_03730 [Gemmatimonadales bacterium]
MTRTPAVPLLALTLLLAAFLAPPAAAQRPSAEGVADRAVVLDKAGVVRWKDDGSEVRLFGANYVVHTASDYRAAGYLHADRKQMIVEDMAQFARMGWDAARLTFWGDWEAADSLGNLIDNDHLDLLDWMIAKGKERGIYFLFSPIQLYNAKWPDALEDTTAPGFGRRYPREKMGTDPAAIRAQVNYLQQILRHVNRYTGVALKDEPSIIFIELVNEPVHHPEDETGSIRYINTLTDAVRSTGCGKLIFYNVSQDFRIGPAIRKSKAQGVTFGWYPTGLNSGHELVGNYLRGVDDYPDMRRPELKGMPRIVYEFDSPDTRNGTMYPAMARSFRSVGAQMALMFAYDMQATASRNLGWQTHYLSLAYTPRKAVSAIIAAEAMRRLPAGTMWGKYPANTRFGDFRLDPEHNLGELVASDAYMHAGSTITPPKDPAALTRIVGYGSSPLVSYEGEGVYFLDRVAAGMWRLEVYPDAVPVRDPFEPPSPDKVVTRAIARSWPMTVRLPGLGTEFHVLPVAHGGEKLQAKAGTFPVRPGVYLLSATANPPELPTQAGRLGIGEYHAPPLDSLPESVEPLTPPAVVAGKPAELRVRIAESATADSALLFIRRTAGDWYHRHWLSRQSGYTYAATIPPDQLRPGPYEFVVIRYAGGAATTFPAGVSGTPWTWNYAAPESWPLAVVDSATPITLVAPERDAGSLTFSRIGDAGRRGLFSLGYSGATGRPALRLELPPGEDRRPLPDYTASLVVRERVAARGATLGSGARIRFVARGLRPGVTLHLSLMEDDGTTWTAPVKLDPVWREITMPLSAFQAGRGVLLPQGFPGQWNYWVEPAEGRGGSGDGLRVPHLERVQLSLRGDERGEGADYGFELESVTLLP